MDNISGYRERVFLERQRLRASFGTARAQQEAVLQDLLDFNAGTEFGRAHGFDRISGLDDFRKAVPINTYADLEPWIERAAAGERGVLSADEPKVYFTSSGSTGAHKKIPVTARFMRTTFFPFYYAAWAPMLEHFPEVLSRPDAVLNLKHDPLAAPPKTADGHPHVGASQVDFGTVFGEPLSAEPGTSAPWATLPVPADGHLEKMYLRLRMAVESDLQCVIGINPAMVAALPYQLNHWWQRIVQDVHDGTPAGNPNPGRARQLERLASYFGTIRPAQVWPNLRVIFCWTTGVASLYLPRLREEFGTGVTVLPAPVAASEGPTAVALDRHASAGSLVVTACAYEFAAAGRPLRPDAETVGPHELEVGGEYHTILSHVGGLYRYAVGDVVRVVDVLDGVPRLEYAGRGTVTPEGLREPQVIEALRAASSSTGLEVVNARCDGGHFQIASRGPWSPEETASFARVLGAALGREVTVTNLYAQAFLHEWHLAVSGGIRPTQVKDRLFGKGPIG